VWQPEGSLYSVLFCVLATIGFVRLARRRGRSGSPAGSPGGSGTGLAGLRERADVLGGDFSATRRTSGGFVVRARIPARSSS
jgi:signal transduction histidine kinase